MARPRCSLHFSRFLDAPKRRCRNKVTDGSNFCHVHTVPAGSVKDALREIEAVKRKLRRRGDVADELLTWLEGNYSGEVTDDVERALDRAMKRLVTE